jgi:hypothetical protein
MQTKHLWALMANQSTQKHSKTLGNTQFQISAPSPAPSTFTAFEGLRRFDLCRATAFRLKMRFHLCLVAAEGFAAKVGKSPLLTFSPFRVLDAEIEDVNDSI